MPEQIFTSTGITDPGYNNKNAQTFAPARAVAGIVDAGANIHLDRDHRSRLQQ